MKICFAASSGGHFEQLMMLKPLMEKYESFVVTEKTGYEVKTPVKCYYLQQVNRRQWRCLFYLLKNTVDCCGCCIKNSRMWWSAPECWP